MQHGTKQSYQADLERISCHINIQGIYFRTNVYSTNIRTSPCISIEYHVVMIYGRLTCTETRL